MGEIKLTGIVTRTTNYRDFDRMITILSPEGRFDLKLAGVRRPGAKLRSAGQAFCFADFELLETRKGNYIMTACDVRDPFFELARDMDALDSAAKLTLLMNDLFSHDEETARGLFPLMMAALTEIAYSKNAAKNGILAAAALKAMDIVGFSSALDFCACCGKPLVGDALFDAAAGGIVCADCERADGAVRISNEAVSLMKLVRATDASKLADIKFVKSPLDEFRRAMELYLAERLDKRFRL